MYTLHIANKRYSSWSLRPWVLMRGLDIAFAEVVHPFTEGSVQQGFAEVSPTAKLPCLHASGEVIWDSLAITEYLAERHAGVWPQDSAPRVFARCAAAEMHSGFQALREHCSMHCGLRLRLREVPDGVRRDVERIVRLWITGLDRFGGPFLGGTQFGAVDAFFVPVALRFRTYGIEVEERAAAYAARLLGLAPARRWVGEALQEPWIHAPYEAAVRARGDVLEDAHGLGGADGDAPP